MNEIYVSCQKKKALAGNLFWSGTMILRPIAVRDSGTEAAVETKIDLIHRKNVKRFALLCLSTPESSMQLGPKGGRPVTHTSWRRRSQPFASRLPRSSGCRPPGTVPFHVSTHIRTRDEPFHHLTYRCGAKCVWTQRSLSPGSNIIYFERCVIVSHCWCVCEHSYKLKFRLESHVMPVPGKCKF